MATLTPHEQALQRHVAEVERAFTAVGTALAEQTRLTHGLVQEAERLRAFTASNPAENPLRRAIQLVEQTLGTLDRFQETGGRVMERLRVQHDRIATLRQSGAHLERAIAPLRIVDTLFRIEAATLPPETQAAFAALTHQISELDVRVRETFSRHFDALGASREAIAHVITHLADDRTEHEHAAGAQREAMRLSIATLDADFTRWRRRDELTAGTIAQLDRDANAIVVAVQYQDITRQKLEHVLDALRSMRAKAASTNDAADAANFVARVAQLQVAQLEAVNADLTGSVNTILTGLENLIGGLRRVEAECLSHAECAHLVSAAENAIEVIDGMLVAIGAPMEHARSNAAAAASAVRSFGGITADLGDTIRELTFGIRLIALNAQVQAAQVKRCDGLEVLARHTYAVSDETSTLAEILGRDVVLLTADLQQLTGDANAFAGLASAAQQELARNVTQAREALRAQRQGVIDTVGRLSALLQQIRAAASELLARAQVNRLDPAPLLDLAAELRGIVTVSAAASGGDEGRASEELDALARSYTMESERSVHAAVVKPPVVARHPLRVTEPMSAEAPAAVPAAAGVTGLGDNVELF